jgi:hypothetical protein
MAIITQHLGRKLAVVALSGGTAFALFGGAAVHTQFSATDSLHADASGALVALSVNGNTDGNGNFSCSNLLPGGPFCGGTAYPISVNNTGTVAEDFTITLGNIIVNSYGVNGDVLTNLDQAQLYMTFGAGQVFGTGSDWTTFGTPGGAVGVPLSTLYNSDGTPKGTGTYTIAHALGASQQDHGSMLMYLEPGSALVSPDDANAWNGASITIPYTITATAGL